jgi:hypothetical protein
MIVFTFMPTMAFADDATTPDELTKCTYTVSDGSVLDATSIEDAMSKVSADGTVTVEGKVNNSIPISGSKAFTLDLSKAELASGVEVTVGANACLVNKKNVYTYHQSHRYTSAQAQVSKVADWGNVTLFCEYGHANPEVFSVQGVEDATTSTDEVVVYNINNAGINTLVRAGLPRSEAEKISWSVKRSEIKDVYALGTVDYVKDGNNVAVKDAAGKVQFFATYTKNGNPALDENGKALTLTGTYKAEEITGDHAATTTTKGYGTYKVYFTLPEATDAVSDTIFVYDAYELGARKNQITGIKAQYKDADGKTVYGNLISAADTAVIPVTITDNNKKYDLVIDDSGKVAFSFVWSYTEGAAKEDPVETLAPSKSELKSCGHGVYTYKVSNRYTDAFGNIKTFEIKTLTVTVAGNHDYENVTTWAKNWNKIDPKHDRTQTVNNVECIFCGNTFSVIVPKSSNHTLLKSDGKVVTYTVEATCGHEGYQYNWCTVSDGETWKDGSNHYLDKKNNKILFNKAIATAAGDNNTTGHPVLVEGTVTPIVGHKLYVQAASLANAWESDSALAAKTKTDDVVVTLVQVCQYDGATFTYKFHKMTFAEAKKTAEFKDAVLDEGSDNTATINNVIHVFGAVDSVVTEGADCTKANTVKYFVKDLKDASGKEISKTVTSTVAYGPHTYTNTVVFSADGKTASVQQQCTVCSYPGHADKDGNVRKQTKTADVTSVDNADGTTTYTATLEGYTLTNNTKTVYDLSKAVVTVNGGNVVDINKLDGTTSAAKIASLKKLVKVTINGAELDSTLYNIAVVLPQADQLVSGVNDIEVTGATDKVVASAKGVAQCVLPGTLSVYAWSYDGKATNESAKTITYDGKAHTVAVTEVYNGAKTLKIEGVDVKYAVATAAETQAEGFDPEKLAYDLTEVSLKDSGDYYVFAQLKKDGYTTAYPIVMELTINKVTLKNTVTASKQVLTYGSTDVTVSTGDAALDEKIGLKLTEEIGKLNVGYYDLDRVISYDRTNYAVSTDGIEIEKRNATIVMLDDSKTYDGKAADVSSLFTIDGAVNGDTLNVIVNVKGGKTPVNAGKYTLVATANDANYKIETVTATYTINKIAQKVNSISPAKRSYTANSKGKLARKKTFKLSADVTGSKDAKLSFSKVSGNAKITVTSAGKVTVKKGLKAGTYTLKVRATKAGIKNYAKATKTKSIKIVIKKKSK